MGQLSLMEVIMRLYRVQCEGEDEVLNDCTLMSIVLNLDMSAEDLDKIVELEVGQAVTVDDTLIQRTS